MQLGPRRFTGIAERPSVAMVQLSKDLGSNSDRNPSGRSVAEIQPDWTMDLQRSLVSAHRTLGGRLVDQPLASMRWAESADVCQLSLRQER